MGIIYRTPRVRTSNLAFWRSSPFSRQSSLEPRGTPVRPCVGSGTWGIIPSAWRYFDLRVV
ncbi:hypothetical protein BD779DRAFT_1546428 [Infundibulicybe gibba]|nr:hypothetical protein BD779DRAFT_1573390 [Infundibulicybe gibba]KAF8881327.1 hypothetical protein BD779DRAFT_1546428 [Infundibulicybe gibba]